MPCYVCCDPRVCVQLSCLLGLAKCTFTPHAVFVSHLVISEYIDNLVQDCSSSIANTLEFLQPCTKPAIRGFKYAHPLPTSYFLMMTSSNGNIFRVTGHLWGESTGSRWISLTKASDAELWYFLWSAPEQTVKQTMETQVIWDAIALIMTSL